MYLKWTRKQPHYWVRSTSIILLFLAGLSCHRAGPARNTTCKRVISLLPSATETLFAIGAGPQVKAVTRFDDFPPKVKKLPKVGGIIDASPEAILAQAPDCVVGTSGILSGLNMRLHAAGASPVIVDYSTIAQVFQSIRILGIRTGHKNRAVSLIHQLKQGLAGIKERTSRIKIHPKILFVTSLHPLYVAGPDSFIGHMIAIAGGDNRVKKGKFPIWSMEEVIAANPDMVLLFQDKCGPLPRDIRNWPVKAAKKGRIISVCDESMVRPGPRLVHAVTKLYDLIHHVPR